MVPVRDKQDRAGIRLPARQPADQIECANGRLARGGFQRGGDPQQTRGKARLTGFRLQLFECWPLCAQQAFKRRGGHEPFQISARCILRQGIAEALPARGHAFQCPVAVQHRHDSRRAPGQQRVLALSVIAVPVEQHRYPSGKLGAVGHGVPGRADKQQRRFPDKRALARGQHENLVFGQNRLASTAAEARRRCRRGPLHQSDG